MILKKKSRETLERGNQKKCKKRKRGEKRKRRREPVTRGSHPPTRVNAVGMQKERG